MRSSRNNALLRIARAGRNALENSARPFLSALANLLIVGAVTSGCSSLPPGGPAGASTVDGSPGQAPGAAKIQSTGTGFFVSQEGHLVTNYHVVRRCTGINIRRPGSPAAQAIVVAQEEKNDFALLKSDVKPPLIAVFSARMQPRLGQPVVIYGFPLPQLLSASGNLTTGIVSGLSGFKDDARLFQISAPIQAGNSGGPILDATGAVIGVVLGKLALKAADRRALEIPQNVNFAIKARLATNFLATNNIEVQKDQVSPASTIEEIAARAMQFTVRVECLR